jgi:hypothetical protein
MRGALLDLFEFSVSFIEVADVVELVLFRHQGRGVFLCLSARA